MATDLGSNKQPEGVLETVVIPGRNTFSGGKKHAHGEGLGLRGAIRFKPDASAGGRAIVKSAIGKVADEQKMDGTGC